MPAVSQRQQKFMGADLARAKAGKKTKTGMSQDQLEDFAATKRTGLPVTKAAKAPKGAPAKTKLKMKGKKAPKAAPKVMADGMRAGMRYVTS